MRKEVVVSAMVAIVTRLEGGLVVEGVAVSAIDEGGGDSRIGGRRCGC